MSKSIFPNLTVYAAESLLFFYKIFFNLPTPLHLTPQQYTRLEFTEWCKKKRRINSLSDRNLYTRLNSTRTSSGLTALESSRYRCESPLTFFMSSLSMMRGSDEFRKLLPLLLLLFRKVASLSAKRSKKEKSFHESIFSTV